MSERAQRPGAGPPAAAALALSMAIGTTVAVALAAAAAPALAAATASASAPGPPAREALLRHAPVLRHDARERSLPVSVEALRTRGTRLLGAGGEQLAPAAGASGVTPSLLGERYADPALGEAAEGDRLDLAAEPAPQLRAPVAYGRVARGSDGRTWLQYWLFWLRNDQDRGIVRTGRHEGDWELVQVRLGAGGAPDRVTLSQHSWGERCAWRETVREGARPVVFVANGSHALYARAGTGDRSWPDPDDEAGGAGAVLRPRVVPIAARSPAWVAWPGRWGASRASPLVPGEHPSPRGPAHQPQRRWSDPSGWDAAHARACGAGPPPRPYWLALAGAGLALAGLAALARRARRRRRGTPRA